MVMEKLEIYPPAEYSTLAIFDKRKLQLLTQHPPTAAAMANNSEKLSMCETDLSHVHKSH